MDRIVWMSMVRPSKKQRRHSGWTTPNSTIRMPKNYIIDNCLEPQIFWDNWNDYRDGYRDYLGDRSKKKKLSFIRMWDSFESDYWTEYIINWKKDRFKIQRLLKRREAMQNRKLYKEVVLNI